MNKYSKIIFINVVLFSISALGFFYLGADRTLPAGFIVVFIGVGFFAMVQYFYLKKFLQDLEHKTKWLFLKNLMRFLLVGIGITICAIIANTIFTNNFDTTVIIFNVVLINVPIAMYAIWFYIFNVFLLKKN